MTEENPFAEFLDKEQENPFAEFLPAKKAKSSALPNYLSRKPSVVDGGYIPEGIIAPSEFVNASALPDAAPLDDKMQPIRDFLKDPGTGKTRETRISSGTGSAGDPFIVSSAFNFDDVYDAAPNGAVFRTPDGKIIERKASLGEMFTEPFQSGLESLLGGSARLGGDFLNAGDEMRSALTDPNYRQLKEGYPESSLPVYNKLIEQLAPMNFGDPLNEGADVLLTSANQRMQDVTAGSTPLRGSLGDMTDQVINDPESVARQYGPQVVRSLPAMLGMLTGNPASAAGVAGGATGIETYGQDRLEGMDVGTSLQDAGVQAIIETLAEKLPLDAIFKPSTNPAAKALRVAGTETLSEGLTGPSQYVAGQAIRGEGIDTTELQNTLVDSLAAGAGMSGPMAGAGLAVDLAAGKQAVPDTKPDRLGDLVEKLKPLFTPEKATSPPVTEATAETSVSKATALSQVEPTDDLDAALTALQKEKENETGRLNTTESADAGNPAPTNPEAASTIAEYSTPANPEAITEPGQRPNPVNRLAELEAKSDTQDLSPDESVEYAKLLKADRTAGKVGGRVMPGIKNSTAYTQAKDAGQLKPVQTFLDADNFKRINDELNHDAGDEAIAQIGQALFDELGEGNVFHRSGDEFIVQGDDPAVIDAAMTRARDRLAKAKLQVTLPDGTVIERTGIGFSYGSGKDITEAENAQRTDKENRAAAGLRTERRADRSGLDSRPDQAPVAGRPQEGQGKRNAPTNDPYSVDSFFNSLDQEIGWSEIGGRIQRSPDMGNAVGGDVIGRSKWIAKPAADGTESGFWRNRPNASLNEAQARAAISKYKAGQKLGPREQEFIDYAIRTASEYSNEARFENEANAEVSRLADMNSATMKVIDELNESDYQEALTLGGLIQRAYEAGAQPEQILDITFNGPESVQARQLIDLAKSLEASRGNDTQSTQEDGDGRPERPQIREEPVPAQGLFAQASTQETVEAERRKRDADRDGRTGSGRTDMLSGDGELFAGNAPEQGSFDGKVESTRDMFVTTRGDREAQNENANPKTQSTKRLDTESVQPRVDASPNLIRRGKYAIESLVRRFGGSVLADTIARDFRETETSLLIGQKVESAADLAVIADVYRNPIFETLRYIFINKDTGEVLGETAVSARLPTSSSIFPTEIEDGAAWIEEQAKTFGATGFWMMHNHPSGNPTPSSADMRATAAIQRGIRGIQLMGHVVLNHKTYGYLKPNGTLYAGKNIFNIPNKGESDPLVSVRGMTLDAKIVSPDSAAQLAKTLFSNTPENSVAVFAVGADSSVRAAMTFPRSVVSTDRFAAAMSMLTKRNGAAMNAMVVTPAIYKSHGPALKKMALHGMLIDIFMVNPDGTVVSLANMKVVNGNNVTRFLERGKKGDKARVVKEDSPAYNAAESKRNEAAESLPADRGTAGWNYKANRWDGRVGALRAARADLQDKMISWRYLQEDLNKVIPDAENVYRLETLMHGRVADQMTDIEREQILPLIEAMRQAKVKPEQLEEYLYARHAQERNERIAEINPKMPDAGSGMTTAQAEKILAAADPKMKALARMVDVITNKTRKRLLDNGLITQEQFDSMKAAYQFYVPLRGKRTAANDFDADMRKGVGGGGVDTRGSVLKQAMGRGEGNLAENILAEIIGDAQRSVILSEKARVGRAVMRTVLANPNPSLWELEPVQTERKLDANGEVYEAIINDMSDPRIIAVRHKGKLYKVSIADEQLAKALNHVGIERMGSLTRLAGKMNRYFSAVLTQYNPAFIPVNATRDAIFGLTALAAEKGEAAALKSALRYPQAITASLRYAYGKRGTSEWDTWANEFAKAGGQTGYVNMPSAEDISTAFGSGKLGGYSPTGIAKVGRVIADLVGVMNTAVENALRLSAYVTLRKNGDTPEAAAEYAKNLTVNFNRKGFNGSKLNSWFLFYNAALQGAVRSSKVMRKPKTWGYLGTLAAAQVAATMFAMGLADDDDEPLANKIPDHVKRRNLWFIVPGEQGEHTLVTIPLPYGFNVLPYISGKMTSAMMNKEDKPAETAAMLAANSVSALVESFFPIPVAKGPVGMLPYPLTIAANVQTNRDDFGRPIRQEDPYAKSDLPRSSMGKPDTLEIFKITSKGLNRLGGGDDETVPAISALDLAPEDLEYVSRALTGGLGKFAMDTAALGGNLADPDVQIGPDNVPIIKRYVTKVDEQAAQRSMYYERRATIDKATKRLRKVFDSEGLEAAQKYLEATPELEGARFDTRKNKGKSGEPAGSVILSGGNYKLEVGKIDSPYGHYKATEKLLTSIRENVETEYLKVPADVFPDKKTRARDMELRRLEVQAWGAQYKFNQVWNRDVVDDKTATE